MNIVLFYLIIFAITFAITELVRRYAIKNNVIDTVNERSSHTTPTPRGGGLGFVITFSLMLVYLAFQQQLSWSLTGIIIVTSLAVAIIGFIDDHQHVSAKIRLIVHLVSSIAFVYLVGGVEQLTILGYQVNLGIIGLVITVIGITWMINLYNFMDGIDGIAATEAITVTLFAGIALYILEPSSNLVTMHFIFAAAMCGFLVLNFPKAKIFMGDIGSGYTGFILAIMMLLDYQQNEQMLWVWLMLFSVFIVDSTVTLIIRVFNKHNVTKAHSTHCYQKLARAYNSHKIVTIALAAINVFLFLPLSYMIIINEWSCIVVFSCVYGLLISSALLIQLKLN